MASLNDQIKAFLAGQSIAFAIGDYATGQPEGGAEEIIFWDSVKLGSAPTSDQLASVAIAAPVPQVVSPRQARLALNAAGLLDPANAAVSAADKATQIAWEYATEIRRDNAVIAAMATQLNLTSAQVDDLFRSAATFT